MTNPTAETVREEKIGIKFDIYNFPLLLYNHKL